MVVVAILVAIRCFGYASWLFKNKSWLAAVGVVLLAVFAVFAAIADSRM